MKRKKRWLANLGLFALSMIFTFALVEIGLRLGGISFPDFYKLDSNCGYSHNPGTTGWFSDEGRSFFQINEAGLRGPAVGSLRPPRSGGVILFTPPRRCAGTLDPFDDEMRTCRLAPAARALHHRNHRNRAGTKPARHRIRPASPTRFSDRPDTAASASIVTASRPRPRNGAGSLIENK